MNAPLFSAAQMSVGHQLRAARKGAGLFRPGLAKLAGVRVETIRKIEKSGAGQVRTLMEVLDPLRCRIADQPQGMTVGEWLQAVRRARGWSQREAARRAGLTPPTIMALERSKGQIASLSQLLASYGVPFRLATEAPGRAPALGRAIAAGENFELYGGDCREWLTKFIGEGRLADSIITDPPYEANTLGAAWDRTGIAFDVAFWRQCFDALKPGAYLLAFAWPRSSHRVTSAIEDAGFQIREPIAWLFSSGTPWGSKDISKAINRRMGAVREVIGSQPPAGKNSRGASFGQRREGGDDASQLAGQPVTPVAKAWDGFATRLKPSREDIIVARKPLSETTVEANVLRWGTGAFNIDGLRIPSARPPRRNRSKGLLGLQERNKREGFRATVPYEGQDGFEWKPSTLGRYPSTTILGDGFDGRPWANHFHVAKPVGRDRWGHPTAKPVELLRKLIRLATPPGGLVLDPFAGCASAGEAALAEGFRYAGAELNPIYAEASRQRLIEPKPRRAKHERRTVPFGWYGGKATQLKWLLPLLPRSVHYCEPFGGAASVLLNRQPSPIETLNDLYGDVAHFFRVLRNQPDDLIDAISLTPFSRDEHAEALQIDTDLDPVERARLFFVRARQTRYGIVHRATTGSWATAREASNRGMSATISKWLGSIDGLHEVATRLRRVQIESRPAIEVIRAYDEQRTLFYVDPPYLHATRRETGGYGELELGDDDHRELADALNACRGKVAISGYMHPLYDELYPKPRWRRIVAPAKPLNISRSVGTRTEVLWVNYRP